MPTLDVSANRWPLKKAVFGATVFNASESFAESRMTEPLFWSSGWHIARKCIAEYLQLLNRAALYSHDLSDARRQIVVEPKSPAFKPFVPHDSTEPEFTLKAVVAGILLAAVFGASKMPAT